jgi:hypothetical protein
MAHEQHRTLDLASDASFQKIEWRAQRWGWTVWLVVVVSAALGLIGPGWLSDVQRRSPDGQLVVRYGRFLHYHNPTELEISLTAPPPSGQWKITLSRALLDRLQITRIEPEPERNEIEADGVSYFFRSDAHAASAKVVFHVEYERYGRASGTVALAGAEPVSVDQFVYP